LSVDAPLEFESAFGFSSAGEEGERIVKITMGPEGQRDRQSFYHSEEADWAIVGFTQVDGEGRPERLCRWRYKRIGDVVVPVLFTIEQEPSFDGTMEVELKFDDHRINHAISGDLFSLESINVPVGTYLVDEIESVVRVREPDGQWRLVGQVGGRIEYVPRRRVEDLQPAVQVSDLNDSDGWTAGYWIIVFNVAVAMGVISIFLWRARFGKP
jgi:hypothetical protein